MCGCACGGRGIVRGGAGVEEVGGIVLVRDEVVGGLERRKRATHITSRRLHQARAFGPSGVSAARHQPSGAIDARWIWGSARLNASTVGERPQ